MTGISDGSELFVATFLFQMISAFN